MRALSKLINLNSPDLVLFVGEALVGNDVVDQLSKFNQVGAALSMVTYLEHQSCLLDVDSRIQISKRSTSSPLSRHSLKENRRTELVLPPLDFLLLAIIEVCCEHLSTCWVYPSELQ